MQLRVEASRAWRRVLVAAPIVTVAVLLGTGAAIAPVSPRGASADHDGMYLSCPDPILEGNHAWVGVMKSGRKVLRVTAFTYHSSFTASANDFVEFHGFRIENDTEDNTLWIPAMTTEDTEPEHDETFSIGFWDEGVWHACVITIEDDDTPEVTHLSITSRPVDGFVYRARESIDVTVNFDAPVEVDGVPLLSLYLDGAGDSHWRGAKYFSGSGSRHLIFRYAVQPHDRDDDGFVVAAASVADDGAPAYGFSGRIFARGTDVHVDYTHPGLDQSPRQWVDGRPLAQRVWVSSSPPPGQQAYRANQVIEISTRFNIDVVAEGEVLVPLLVGGQNDEGAHRQAAYLRGAGTDTLVFGYTVRPGDMDRNGISVGNRGDLFGISRFGGDGTIKARGTDVEGLPFFEAPGRQRNHKVDAVPPTVERLTPASRPLNDAAYGAGEVIRVEAVFSEDVTVTGAPYVELEIGGVARHAVLQPTADTTSRSSFSFDYEVQPGDADADGLSIAANALRLGGGSIHDGAGNVADRSHAPLPPDPNQRVVAP